jgi:hypothetical protein
VSSTDDHDRLSALTTVLETARSLVQDLQGNPLLTRLVDVFMRMPESDREVVIGAIEREVQTRLLSAEVADPLTGVALRPNPNARLYLRVVEPHDADPVESMAFLRAAYSLQRGIDGLDPSWRTMIATALRQMEPDARAKLDAFNRAMQVLLDEAACAAAEPDASAPIEPAPPPTPPDVSARTAPRGRRTRK